MLEINFTFHLLEIKPKIVCHQHMVEETLCLYNRPKQFSVYTLKSRHWGCTFSKGKTFVHFRC